MAAQPTMRYSGPVDERALRFEQRNATRLATDHPVVVGVDGSMRNEPAIRWAAAEAASLGVGLVLVCVTDADEETADPEMPSALQAAARATLERATRIVAGAYPRLAVRTEVRLGRPRLELASDDPGMLVVGRRGSGGFARMALGSSSLWLAGTAENVVVVIPAESAQPDGDGEDGRGGVLVAVDPLAPEPGVLQFAFERAHQRALPLRVVAAWEVPPVMAHGRAGIRQAWQRQEERVTAALERALRPWVEAYPDVAVEREVVHGHPAGTVLDQQAGVELTVVGRGGGRRSEGFRMGPITRSVLHLGTGPVAVVP